MPVTGNISLLIRFRVHKVILASGSKYMVQVFRSFPSLNEVQVPLPYNQGYENNSDDQVIRILKYLYAN